MNRWMIVALTAASLGLGLWADSASAGGRRSGPAANNCGCSGCWNGGYYDSAWGTPVALVVPPTATFQTHWGWGVGGTWVTPVYPQFGRNFPGPSTYDPRALQPTPPWPSSTDQFGVYAVRGPW
jgi:hypothetical protein